MPLDDIFYKKNAKLEAKNFKHFWRRCAIATGVIVWLFLITNRFLVQEYLHISTIISTLLGVITISSLLSYFLALFASYIPYRGFLPEERIDIYFYMFATVGLFLYLLSRIDFVFNNSAIADWLYYFFF